MRLFGRTRQLSASGRFGGQAGLFAVERSIQRLSGGHSNGAQHRSAESATTARLLASEAPSLESAIGVETVDKDVQELPATVEGFVGEPITVVPR